MPRTMLEILVIQTGGTIDKEYPKSVGGYAFEIGEAATRRIFQRINPAVKIHHETVCQKDSQDIGDTDRQAIVQCIKKTEVDKILITHGTDTLIETAAFIAKNVTSRAVVLCGALRPEAFKNSDADFNVGCAVGALNTASHGVYVAMCGRVYPWDSVTRDLHTGQFVAK